MKEIMSLNPENASETEIGSYTLREAVRAVVIDQNKKTALLYVSLNGYYKLPGGGIESRESHREALSRECREEIGCEVEIEKEIGIVVEYRKMFHLKQISYCYLAKVRSKEGTTNYTKEELEKGFRPVWLSLEDAVQELSDCKTVNIEGMLYIVPRDKAFLQEARELLRES